MEKSPVIKRLSTPVISSPTALIALRLDLKISTFNGISVFALYRCKILWSRRYEGPPFKYKKTFEDHTRFVNCVRFSPDGSSLLTGKYLGVRLRTSECSPPLF